MNGHMGPPSQCYACEGLGWILGDIGVDLSLSDVAMPLLMLKPPVECISHPYDMYALFTTGDRHKRPYQRVISIQKAQNALISINFIGLGLGFLGLMDHCGNNFFVIFLLFVHTTTRCDKKKYPTQEFLARTD